MKVNKKFIFILLSLSMLFSPFTLISKAHTVYFDVFDLICDGRCPSLGFLFETFSIDEAYEAGWFTTLDSANEYFDKYWASKDYNIYESNIDVQFYRGWGNQ